MELTTIDYEILEFINRFSQPIHINKILDKFPDNKFSTKYRLKLLNDKEKHHSGHFYLENTSYITLNYFSYKNEHGITYQECLNTYSITEKGKITLQEYKIFIKNEKLKTFKHSFLYPISSAIITAILTAYITTKVIINK